MKFRLVRFAILVCLFSTTNSLLQPLLDNVGGLIGIILPGPQAKVVSLIRQPIGSGTITVGGKCIDIADDASGANGTPLLISTCNKTSTQNWTVRVDGTIRALGKCMQVQTCNFSPVKLYNCNGTPEQQWIVLSSGQVKNVGSNKCLDVKYSRIEDGQPLVIYRCRTSVRVSQSFTFSVKTTVSTMSTVSIKYPTTISTHIKPPTTITIPIRLITTIPTPINPPTKPNEPPPTKPNEPPPTKPNEPPPTKPNEPPPTKPNEPPPTKPNEPPPTKPNEPPPTKPNEPPPTKPYEPPPTTSNEPPPSPITAEDPQPSGTCEIKVADKCVDVTGGNSASGTQLSVYTCNDSPAQDWTVQGDGTIRAYGKCMDVKDGATDNLTPVQLWDCNQTEAQQWVFLSSGQLKNPKSNRCLDVKGGGTLHDGQLLIIYDCRTTALENQAFESTCEASPTVEPPPSPITAEDPQPSGTCEIKVADKCVDVTGGNSGNSASGTQLSVYTCNDSPAQDWTVQGDGTIRAYGKCMDVKDGATDNLTPVQLWDCNQTEAQQWVFLSSGQLKNPKSNRCLDVKGGGTLHDGQLLIIYDCRTTALENQAFESTCEASPPVEPPPSPITAEDPQPSGTCEIKVADKCVDVTGGNSASGTQLSVYTCNDSPAQDWTVQGDGTIRAYGKCMDVKDGATDNLTPVQLWDCNQTEAQQWVFLSSGQLKNPKSNRCLDVKGGGTLHDGQLLIIYDCRTTALENQAFESTCEASPTVEPPPSPITAEDPQPSGTCEIKVADKCVDVTGGNSGNSASGTQLSVYTCNDSPAQDWTVQGDGTIRAYGKCMDVKDGATDNLTPVQLWDCNQTEAQQWVFLSSGQLKNPNSNRCLDVKGGDTLQDGQPLIIFDCRNTNFENQAFESTCDAA